MSAGTCKRIGIRSLKIKFGDRARRGFSRVSDLPAVVLGLIASPTTSPIEMIVPDDFTGVDARSLDLRPP